MMTVTTEEHYLVYNMDIRSCYSTTRSTAAVCSIFPCRSIPGTTCQVPGSLLCLVYPRVRRFTHVPKLRYIFQIQNKTPVRTKKKDRKLAQAALFGNGGAFDPRMMPGSSFTAPELLISM